MDTEDNEKIIEDKKIILKNTEEIDENINPKKQKIIKIRNIVLIILFNLIFPYVLYLISNISNDLFWQIRAVRRTSSIYIFSFVYELWIIYGLYFLFKSIFKKSFISNCIIAAIFNIIQIISFYKIEAVSKPFWPEDILLAGNAMQIAGYGGIEFKWIIALQVILTIILLLIQFLITRYTKYEKTLRIPTRVIMGILSLAILCVSCLFNWTNIRGFVKDNFNNETNYSIYGSTVEFFRNAYKLVQKPKLDIYSKERLDKIKEESSKLENNNNENSEEEKPNIIVIMAESFSDITKSKYFEFEEDPLPTYRELIKSYPHGNTVVSIFGGETSMSEFEFLTGSSTRFLDGTKYPYSQIVKDDTKSIVTTLKDNGYYTTAIHANDGSFYNRDMAYKYLGFDRLVFKDDMEKIDNVYDDCVSDMDTAEEIVRQYESINDKNKFIFAITMETHVPYNSDRYKEKEIKEKLTKAIPATELLECETYIQGIHNFDKSIKYLTEYFSKKDEKVMLVFYGDHLPAFKTIYYNEYKDSIEKYKTPYCIWTNYEMTKEEIKKYSKENISIPGLSMMVLEKANITLPWYYTYISEFYKAYPVCTNKYLYDAEGNELDINTNNEQIENYNIIIFDLLYEKNIK